MVDPLSALFTMMLSLFVSVLRVMRSSLVRLSVCVWPNVSEHVFRLWLRAAMNFVTLLFWVVCLCFYLFLLSSRLFLFLNFLIVGMGS